MNELLKRVDAVYVATGGGAEKKPKDDVKLDAFQKAKRELHDKLKDVRVNLKERDELLESQPSSTTTIEKSQQIRRDIKSARDAANLMREELNKDQRKKVKKLPAEELEKRSEQLELVWKHIEECERLEKRRYQRQANPQQRGELMSRSKIGAPAAASSSGAAISSPGLDDYHPALHSELPDIEVQEQLQQLRQRDKKLDEGIEEISQGVGRLKQVAQNIGEEIVVQTEMLNEIEVKVDNANQHLLSLNRKMKDTLKKVKGADRFIMNFILIMIVLGIATYIWNMVSN